MASVAKLPLVHVVELHSRKAPGHQVSSGQGLGLATKAPAKPDELLATQARLTTTFYPGHLNAASTILKFFHGGGVFFPAQRCRRHSTPNRRVVDVAGEPLKAPRLRHTKITMGVH